jgi:2-polyprenyl-3-methyl-5-hydroxy-6-metoxy-1,4-benzoquinol methylase
MNPPKTLPSEYFEAIHRASSDPWNLATSDYEHRKYQDTLASIPQRRFRRGFEIGCAIGILSRLLAQRVDHLLAVDIEELALTRARSHCAQVSNIEWRRMAVPQDWPDGSFDLVVISEVLYYFSWEDIHRIAAKTLASLHRDGIVLLVHWTHPTDLPLGGDEAVDRFLSASAEGLSSLRQTRTSDYRLDILQRQSS